MLRQTRRLAALEVSRNVHFEHRRIPSEWNPADDPSRRIRELKPVNIRAQG
jgi:hypothetical protein